ncbi:MAG: hypothetical protein ACFFCZ_29295 [Promethearchaeota archaeon]
METRLGQLEQASSGENWNPTLKRDLDIAIPLFRTSLRFEVVNIKGTPTIVFSGGVPRCKANASYFTQVSAIAPLSWHLV